MLHPPIPGVFLDQGQKRFASGLYARVSTHDQKTLPMQLETMRDYAAKRNWTVAIEVQDVASGATSRPQRETLIAAARRREIDCVLVWRLDRWGRSLVDLMNSLQELIALEVGFVSLCEALDLTTPSGRALAGMLAVFAEFERDILRDRVKAGIDRARKDGNPHGRPSTAGKLAPEMKRLRQEGRSYREIAQATGGQSRLGDPIAAYQPVNRYIWGRIRTASLNLFSSNRVSLRARSPTCHACRGDLHAVCV